jgi:hypothetical protein
LRQSHRNLAIDSEGRQKTDTASPALGRNPAAAARWRRSRPSVTFSSHSMSESVTHQAEPTCQGSSGARQGHARTWGLESSAPSRLMLYTGWRQPGRPRPRGVSGSLPFSVTSLPQVSRHRSLSGSSSQVRHETMMITSAARQAPDPACRRILHPSLPVNSHPGENDE